MMNEMTSLETQATCEEGMMMMLLELGLSLLRRHVRIFFRHLRLLSKVGVTADDETHSRIFQFVGCNGGGSRSRITALIAALDKIFTNGSHRNQIQIRNRNHRILDTVVVLPFF